MDDRTVWVVLADRLAAIRAARVADEEEKRDVVLVFDSHDQATVVPRPPPRKRRGGESRMRPNIHWLRSWRLRRRIAWYTGR